MTEKGTLNGLFDATFARRSPEEREAIKDRYATRTRVLNAADPLKAKAIDILRHYVANILPNDLKAQLVASTRELAVQYVELLSKRHIMKGSRRSRRRCRHPERHEPEAALNAGGDVAFLAAALPDLDTIRALEFPQAAISIDHNDLPHLKAWGGAFETKQRIERFKRPLLQDPASQSSR